MTQPGVTQQALPPLPGAYSWDGRAFLPPLYTAEQMQEYARFALAQQSAQPVGESTTRHGKNDPQEVRDAISLLHRSDYVCVRADRYAQLVESAAAPSAPVVVHQNTSGASFANGVCSGEAVAWQARIKASRGWHPWTDCSKDAHDSIAKSGSVEIGQAEVRALGVIAPAPAVEARTVDDAMVERACKAAYAEMDMGLFPQDAVNPQSDRDFVRAALAASSPPAPGEGRKFTGVGHLERTGYIPAGSAVERESAQPQGGGRKT